MPSRDGGPTLAGMSEGHDDAQRLAQRLATLPEQGMRVAMLAEQLLAREPADAAWLLDVLATAGRAGGPPFDLALLAAIELAGSERIPYEQRRAIYEAAEARGLAACRELLYSSSSAGESPQGAAAPRPLTPGTRPLTLGERKSLARTWRRDVIERLLVDPHVDVIALLLANPRLTEDDVLRIATARRSSAEVLVLISDARRWRVRARVRQALLRNPRLPEAIGLRLVGLCNRTELRVLESDPALADAIVEAVRRRLVVPS